VTAATARVRALRQGRANAPDARLLARAEGTGRRLALSAACGFAAAGVVIVQAILLSLIVADVFRDGLALPAVTVPLVTFAALAVARAPLLVGADVLAQDASGRVRRQTRADLTAHLLELGPAYTGRERSGELTGVIVDGLDALDGYVTSFLPARSLAVAVPLLVLVTTAFLDPPTTAVLLFTGPILVLLLGVIGGRTRDITERRFTELGWLSAFFLDILAGLSTLKLFGRSAEQVDNLRAFSRRYGDATMEVLRTAFQTSLVLEWGGAVAVALVAVEISLRLMAGTIDFERALAVLVIVPEFFLPIRNLAARYHSGSAGRTAAERIVAILDEPVGPGRSVGQEHGVRGEPVPPEAAIRFDRVTVVYPGRSEPAIRDLELDLPPRGMVALVGPTGAGKTTIANVLLRFVEPRSGRVLVGGVPLLDLDGAAWRAHVSWVPQRPHLFHGSIADNVSLARPDVGAEAVRAAEAAAGVDSFLRALPLGDATPVGDDGLRLSGGQRQRVAIARAVLADARLIVLDEATSQLDRASETAIRTSLSQIARDRLVVVISHRLALAQAADTVAVVEHGRVVEHGPPGALVAAGGAYARLLARSGDEQP
jgi:ATP-binding cassette subfamily C protein CydD